MRSASIASLAPSILLITLFVGDVAASAIPVRGSELQAFDKRGRGRSGSVKPGVAAPKPGVADPKPGVAAPKADVKASDLKTSNYRQEAIKNNKPGAYVADSNGQVKWDPKAKGDAEHVIESGLIKDVMNQLGIGKDHPMFSDIKEALNHSDNLSMLDPSVNRAKAQLTADPNRDPKDKAAANSYMAQPDIQDKVAKTLEKLRAASVKHNVPQFQALVRERLKNNFSGIKRSYLDGEYELEERWDDLD